jgi:hypothetical protein
LGKYVVEMNMVQWQALLWQWWIFCFVSRVHEIFYIVCFVFN